MSKPHMTDRDYGVALFEYLFKYSIKEALEGKIDKSRLHFEILSLPKPNNNPMMTIGDLDTGEGVNITYLLLSREFKAYFSKSGRVYISASPIQVVNQVVKELLNE